MLGGRCLLDYGVLATQVSKSCSRIICSTDDRSIGERATALGIEVDWRPKALATDEAAVADVVREFLTRQQAQPDILVLVQPTSPFLLPEHVTGLLDLFINTSDCRSAQTVAPIPHNYHTWNQRLYESGTVRFLYAKERQLAYNKQLKPKVYSFGNLVAIRPDALIDGMGFFAEPSLGYPIAWPYNLDVDGPDDLRLAEALIQTGMVRFDHLKK